MPAPYPFVEIPPGDFGNTFDFQAMHMAGAHNTFISGINAVVAHAPHVSPEDVPAFITFTLTVLDIIHNHHEVEETFYFPAIEEKLGKGSLSGNVDEHANFVPQIKATEAWLLDIQAGKEQYSAQVLLEKIDSFSDTMFEHLSHEIQTLESSRMRSAFTEKELKHIDDSFMKHATKGIDFYKALPITLVLTNPDTPWFPPFPTPVKWATKWWFGRRYAAAWKFGTTDMDGNLKPLPN